MTLVKFMKPIACMMKTPTHLMILVPLKVGWSFCVTHIADIDNYIHYGMKALGTLEDSLLGPYYGKNSIRKLMEIISWRRLWKYHWNPCTWYLGSLMLKHKTIMTLSIEIWRVYVTQNMNITIPCWPWTSRLPMYWNNKNKLHIYWKSSH